MLKKLLGYFIQGLFFIVPLGIVAYLIYWVESKVAHLFTHTPHMAWIVLITFVAILVIGFLASNLLTRPLITFLDRNLTKLPVLGIVYKSVRDLMAAFVGDKKKFNKPVLVKINDEETVERLGFVTNEDLSLLGIKDRIAVYLPHSYAFSGWVVIVPKERVTYIDAKASEVMAFLVSGGVTLKKEEEDKTTTETVNR